MKLLNVVNLLVCYVWIVSISYHKQGTIIVHREGSDMNESYRLSNVHIQSYAVQIMWYTALHTLSIFSVF